VRPQRKRKGKEKNVLHGTVAFNWLGKRLQKLDKIGEGEEGKGALCQRKREEKTPRAASSRAIQDGERGKKGAYVF